MTAGRAVDRRQWRLRGRTLLSRPGWVTVIANPRSGTVDMRVGDGAGTESVAMTPEDAQRLRKVLNDAAARALQDLDGWA